MTGIDLDRPPLNNDGRICYDFEIYDTTKKEKRGTGARMFVECGSGKISFMSVSR